MNRILCAIFLCSLLLPTLGCDDDGGATLPGTSPLYGTWNAVAATVDGIAVDVFTATNCNPQTVRLDFIFESDGDFFVREFNGQGNLVDQDTGTFTINGATAVITWLDKEHTSFTWSVDDDDDLELTMDDEGSFKVLMLTRDEG